MSFFSGKQTGLACRIIERTNLNEHKRSLHPFEGCAQARTRSHTCIHAHTELGGTGLQGSPLRPQEHPHQAALLRGISRAWHKGQRPGSSSSSSDSLSPKPIITGGENDSLAQQPPSADGRGAGRWPWWWLEGKPGTQRCRVRGGQWWGTDAMGTVGFGVGRR